MTRLIASHHLHELVKVDSSRAVSVDFLNDSIQICACQLVVEGCQDFLQRGCGDVSVSLTIVETESLLQLSERRKWKVSSGMSRAMLIINTNCCMASSSSSSRKCDAMLQNPSKLTLFDPSMSSSLISDWSSASSKSWPMVLRMVEILMVSMKPHLVVSNIWKALRMMAIFWSSSSCKDTREERRESQISTKYLHALHVRFVILDFLDSFMDVKCKRKVTHLGKYF